MAFGAVLKLCGAALLLSAPLAASISAYLHYRTRQKYFAAFSDIIARSALLILSERQPLPRVLEDLEQNGPKELHWLWHSLRADLAQENADFDELWRKALADIPCFSHAERALLSRYALALRSYDPACIAEELDALGQRIALLRKDEQNAFMHHFKARVGAGFSGAFLLLILLV